MMMTRMARVAAARRVRRRRECGLHHGTAGRLLRVVTVVTCSTLAPCYDERSGWLAFTAFSEAFRRAY